MALPTRLHNKPTPFRIATKRSPIATQLQHIVTNCISLLQQVMRHSDLRVSLQLYIFVAIGFVAIDYVAIIMLQLYRLSFTNCNYECCNWRNVIGHVVIPVLQFFCCNLSCYNCFCCNLVCCNCANAAGSPACLRVMRLVFQSALWRRTRAIPEPSRGYRFYRNNDFIAAISAHICNWVVSIGTLTTP